MAAEDKKELYSKIQKQVDFYFSDSNYAKDKFLRSQAAQDEQGFVPITTLLTFKRLQSLTKNAEDIMEAMKGSTVVTVDETRKMIKRTNPLPEEDLINKRTLFTKGWPTNATIEEISEACSKIGKVNSVRLRRRPDRSQKPSAFVEFSSEEEANKIAQEGKLEHLGKPILFLTKAAYHLSKQEEKAKRRAKRDRKGEKKTNNTSEGKQEETKTENNNNNEGPANKKQKTSNKASKKEETISTIERLQGVVVHFTGLGDEVSREILKEKFGTFGDVEFVDFSRGEHEGYIRFSTPEQAKKVVSEFKEELGGKKPTLNVLEGDVEKQYWEKVEGEKKAKQKSKAGKKKGYGGKGGKKRKRF